MRAYLISALLLFGTPAVALSQVVYQHSSTAEEGFAHGMADVIRSSGEANLRNSEAARNYEEARSRDLDNRLKGTQTYFEMRKLNKEYRAAERGPLPTSEDYVRYAKEAAPKRLSASDVDPLTGRVDWPLILRLQTYQAQTKQLDTLFVKRAEQDGQVTAEQYMQIQKLSKELEGSLKKNIRDYPPTDYVKAKGFIESLAHESRFSPS